MNDPALPTPQEPDREHVPEAPDVPAVVVPQRSRVWRRIGFLLATIAVLAGGTVTAGWYYLAHFVQGPPADIWQLLRPAGDHFFGDRDSRTIMILGVDYNYTDNGMPFSKGARSDSMFLLNVTRDGQHVGMLSMPRDMFVTFPDGHQDKVNSAYSDGGVPLVRRMLEHFLAVPVDYYVVVRINAAARVIDRLGGLPIQVERDMDYDDNWGHLHIHLKHGRQILNGDQAVGYARFRHDEEGDRGRMRRQQQIVDALMAKLQEGSLLTRLERMNDLARIIRDNLETDVRADQWVDVARIYRSFDRKNFRTAHLDGTDTYVDGMAVILPPDEATRHHVVRSVMAGLPVAPADLRLEILNGSGVAGAAASLRDKLQNLGFTVVHIGDAPTTLESPTSYVLPRTANPSLLQQTPRLIAAVGSTLAVKRPSGSVGSDRDFTIVLGNDWRHHRP